MFCSNCGTQIPEGSLFCGNCGAKVEAPTAPQPAPQPAYEAVQQPAYEAVQQPVFIAPQQSAAPSATSAELDDLAGTVLSRGILGLIMAFVGVPGIFICAKAKRLAAEYARKAGCLSGRAKVGSILAKVGFPISFAMTGFYVLYTIILMAAMM